MPETFHIGSIDLTLSLVKDVLFNNLQLSIDPTAKKKIEASHRFLKKQLSNPDAIYYGINTGFGHLCNEKISAQDLLDLQENLVRSHACGMGDPIPVEIVQIILLLKIQNLSLGYSGVRVELVEGLIALYNAGIFPVIFEKGSLGASGDLAPLAHLSLALFGEGEVHYRGSIIGAEEALRLNDIAPLTLEVKEGLALINGTQFTTAYALWCLLQTENLLHTSNFCVAASCEAFDCHTGPFEDELHLIRKHAGQLWVARSCQDWWAGSDISARTKHSVQDPYSFRCAPQVQGASYDVYNYVKSVVETEINSVTDNPNIFSEEGKILSGGNFHAQPIALALDYLAIAIAEIGSISERRTFLLTSGQRGLPVMLIKDAGLHSGMMIIQYTAAAIASQNKQLCTPASVDSIVSSMGQEDHVSMGANAGTKCARVVQNVWEILGIEWLAAAQALDYRNFKVSNRLLEIRDSFRKKVKHLEGDRVLHTDMVASMDFLKNLTY